MPLKIFVPTLLQKNTGGLNCVEIEAKTVRDLIDKLDERYPGFRARICGEDGELRNFINLYIEDEDIRFLDNLSTLIPDGSEVSIIPAIAGG
ncbi:MAG: MoaD/ThiS family protein [Acidobacteriota bacterium]